jgi:hypothetical protein
MWLSIIEIVLREELVLYTFGLSAILGWNVANAGTLGRQRFLRCIQWVALMAALMATPLILASILGAMFWNGWHRHGPTYDEWLFDAAVKVSPATVFWIVFLTAFWWMKEGDSANWTDENLHASASARRRKLIRLLSAGGLHPGALIVQMMFVPLGFIAASLAISHGGWAFFVWGMYGELPVKFDRVPSISEKLPNSSLILIEANEFVYLDGVLIFAPSRYVGKIALRNAAREWAANRNPGARLVLRADPEVRHEMIIYTIDAFASEGLHDFILLDVSD